jgi:hypothetical protein
MLNRPESSVSVGKNEYGELIFSCDNHGPVIHRTPEELGIPRTIAGALPVVRKRTEVSRPEVERLRAMLPHRRVPVAGDPATLGKAALRKTEKQPPILRPAQDDKRNNNRKERSMAGMAVGGGRANNRVPSRRYGMPVVSVVEMDEVPDPCHRGAGIAAPLYAQIVELKHGALKVDFETEGHASYALTRLRKIAKKEKANLLSSKSADGKTRWFWLEK